MRRLGFKAYVPDLIKYRVDGRTLLLLDTGDYPSININTRLHIRRIQVEIDKRWPPWKREEINSIHMVRREKLKRQGELEAAAKEIQRVFRGHIGRKDVKNLHEVRRVLALKKSYHANLEKGKVWWLEKINDTSLTSSDVVIPPKNSQTTRLSISSSAPDLGSFPIGVVPALPIPTYPLPPLKNFGKKRTYLSCKGWGGYTTLPDGKDVWKPLTINQSAPAGVSLPAEGYRDTHITTYFSEKLSKTGYDRKREQMRMVGEPPVRFRNKEKEKELEKKKIRDQNQPLALF